MIWGNNKKEQEITQQFIWRDTLHPVCSERAIQQYARWTAELSKSNHKEYFANERNNLIEAKKHADKNGTRETFKPSSELLRSIFDYAQHYLRLEERIAHIDKMIEANIAGLNGGNIVELKKKLNGIEPLGIYTYLDGQCFDQHKTVEENRKIASDNGFQNVFRNYESQLQNLSFTEDTWNSYVKDKNWSADKSMPFETSDNCRTDEGWITVKD